MYLIQNRGKKSPLGIFLRNCVAFPFVFIMVIPVVIADIFFEAYHQVVFPILGIPKLKRSHFIHITDRAKLPYLSLLEKFGCAYCGYVNGWLHYASVIAGRTETYFCAIAHLERKGYQPSKHEESFAKYGDDAALKKRYFMHDLKYEAEGDNA